MRRGINPEECVRGSLTKVPFVQTPSQYTMSRPAPKWPSSASVAVDEGKSGETATRRNALSTASLVTGPVDGVDTVYDVLQFAARTHGTKNALGWRDVVDIHEEEKEVKKMVDGKATVEKKKWKYFQLSPYSYLNFVEVKEAVDEIAAGLIKLGVNKGDVVNVYAQTRYVPTFPRQ